MTQEEREELLAEYDTCRKQESQMLSKLRSCDFQDEDMFRNLVPVQQRRAMLVRLLQIDYVYGER